MGLITKYSLPPITPIQQLQNQPIASIQQLQHQSITSNQKLHVLCQEFETVSSSFGWVVGVCR